MTVMKKWTAVGAGFVAAAVVAVVVSQVWIPRQGGPVPFGERQSLEEYMGNNVAEVSRMAGQVAAESGGELRVVGLPYVQTCGVGQTQGYRLRGFTTVAPSISFDRLEELVKAHHRDGVTVVWVQNEYQKDGTRNIYLNDREGNSVKLKYSENDIVMSSRSACLPTDKPLNNPGQFVLPSVEEAFPGVPVTVSDNADSDLHPVPTLTLGAQADPQSDAQSGTQSGS
ncbi:DUF4853 domain-containing protein [Actinomyces sp.]